METNSVDNGARHIAPHIPTLRQRVRGALVGALVGDALGVPVEFCRREERDRRPVSNMEGGGTWHQPPGTWSDDGAMMLCLADGIIADFDLDGIGRRFLDWRYNAKWTARGQVFDCGGTTNRALTRLAAGTATAEAGISDVNSNGNGSLMRTTPIALRFATCGGDVIAQHAMAASRITHAHARSQLCCAFLALVASRLLQGSQPKDALLAGADDFAPWLRHFPDEAPTFARLLRPDFCAQPRNSIRSGVYVVETLEASLWCLLNTATFEDAVIRAVNLGGDADTTGCVTGALAGIVYGEEAIPKRWRQELPRVPEAETTITAFVAAVVHDAHDGRVP